MAKSSQEQHCSLCFHLLEDPVTTSCGHSFCSGCVQSHWDEEEEEDQRESPSCPQCGQGLVSWPVPDKNLTDLVGKLRETGLRSTPGPAGVDCSGTGGKPDGSIDEKQLKVSATETKVDSEDPPKTKAGTEVDSEDLPKTKAGTEVDSEDLPKTKAGTEVDSEDLPKTKAGTEVDLDDLPKTRAEFLKYSCEITLDPNTVQTRLLLSDGNRRASQAEEQQVYPSHPERFIDGSQVLSKESLTGRHYWEVERSGGAVSVAVSYKDVSRTGTESIFGCNYRSWALDCFDNRFLVRHMYITAAKPHPMSPRVGVYLDHGAGILSFYSVSETMEHLHTVRTTFDQPLHAGLWVHGHTSSAVVCHEDSS